MLALQTNLTCSLGLYHCKDGLNRPFTLLMEQRCLTTDVWKLNGEDDTAERRYLGELPSTSQGRRRRPVALSKSRACCAKLCPWRDAFLDQVMTSRVAPLTVREIASARAGMTPPNTLFARAAISAAACNDTRGARHADRAARFGWRATVASSFEHVRNARAALRAIREDEEGVRGIVTHSQVRRGATKIVQVKPLHS